MSDLASGNLVDSIKTILDVARKNAYRAVNFAMVEAYWNIGRLIVEDEQQGQKRAEYGKGVLKELATQLTKEYGKGFDLSNLKNMRKFYLCFSKGDTVCDLLKEGSKHNTEEKSDTLCRLFQDLDNQVNKKYHTVCGGLRRELSWSHYRALTRVDNQSARKWYMNEAAEQNWSVRALQRQINSFYYDRLLASKDKDSVAEEAKEKTTPLEIKPIEMIKDPYVLEFLALKDRSNYHESEMEQALMDKLQDFLLELGKGFAFVARQKRISTETKEFYVDLVFYNYILKCFVLIDLKTGELTHQDVGQMDMYVRMFDDLEREENDNPTVGIILCSEKDETIVKYSVLNDNEKLFASKYLLYLPSEEQFKREIAKERRLTEIEMNHAGDFDE